MGPSPSAPVRLEVKGKREEKREGEEGEGSG